MRVSPRYAAALAVLALAACDSGEDHYSRARVIASLDQAIGGPKASAREGDFLLENDQIRVVVEQGGPSRLPLGQGGSIVDIDLNRYQDEFRSGRGLDQVGQFVPVTNLFHTQADISNHVRITRSLQGAEVTAASVGEPIIPLVLGLNVLLDQRFSENLEPRLYTEYEVRPGERLLRITTTVAYGVPFCPVEESDGCNAECDDALYDDDCDCPSIPSRCTAGIRTITADPLPDRPFGGILHVLLGDVPQDGSQCETAAECDTGEECVDITQSLGGQLRVCRAPEDKGAGVLLGDMLIFAKDTSAFFRGPGFDSESDIRRLFDSGLSTLERPLQVDAIYAIGNGVSYGYTSPEGSMLVPILSGPFSMGAPAAASCRTDDETCLNGTLIRFERWLAVGDGDVSSAADVIARARGDEMGRASGVVVSKPSGNPVSGAQVFAIADPRDIACGSECPAECDFADLSDADVAALSLEDVLEANRCRTRDGIFLSGKGGLESMAATDPVGDPVVDGGYTLNLAPGRYVLVAKKGLLRSNLGLVSVQAGKTARQSFFMPEPARLDYVILDQSGQPSPGEIQVGHCLPGPPCGDDGDCGSGTTCQQGTCACERELPVPLELGGARVQIDGVVATQHARDGIGTIDLPPGEYEVIMSRGPNYSIDQQVITVQSNRTNLVRGKIARVVDRTGWSTSDFHIHAAPSLDSDVSLEDRLTSLIANDMDYFSSSDHEWITDYGPLIQSLDVRNLIGSQIGLEISPLDLGHYIGYPLEYRAWEDGNRVQGNGAFDWHGLLPAQIFQGIADAGAPGKRIIVHLPHPYSYFDAYRLDPQTLEPVDSFLTFINPLVDPAAFDGNFDVMELFNSKNYDLLRRPTVGEVRYLSSEFDRLTSALRSGQIDNLVYDHDLYLVMTEAAKRMMHRTAAEQEAAIAGAGAELPCTCGADGDCATGLVCDPSTLACVEGPIDPDATPAPENAICRTQRGIIDDWFLMLNRGVVKTGLSGSDVHDQEAGNIRTFLRTGPVTAPNLTSDEITTAVLAHRAIVSSGPMIHFTVGQAEVGDMVPVSSGEAVSLRVQVEKAPWYDVDRVEIYRNGELIHWAVGCERQRPGEPTEPHGHPCVKEGEEVVAYDETIQDTPERDSWYAVIAVGIDGRPLAPVYSSVGLARFGTGELTNEIFDLVPLLRQFRVPRAATLYPMFPWAVTNPIWVDVGGNGWTPVEPPPSWCRDGDYGC